MTAGYSGTPQLRKLGIVPGVRLDVVGAPDGWAFDEPPVGTLEAGDHADVVLVFAPDAATVASAIPGYAERVRPAGALWIAWPRKAAGHPSDVTENLLREVALPLGLVDVKVAAIDEHWSGLKLVWRRELR